MPPEKNSHHSANPNSQIANLNYPTIRPALLWEPLSNNKVRCLLCERHCIIPENHRGFCQTRTNIQGKLYTLVYGLLSALESRPIEIKPFFHYYPASSALTFSTYSCNFRCPWCQNHHLSRAIPFPNLKSDISHRTSHITYRKPNYISPEELVNLAIKSGDQGLCGSFTEPTLLFEYALDTFKIAKNTPTKKTMGNGGTGIFCDSVCGDEVASQMPHSALRNPRSESNLTGPRQTKSGWKGLGETMETRICWEAGRLNGDIRRRRIAGNSANPGRALGRGNNFAGSEITGRRQIIYCCFVSNGFMTPEALKMLAQSGLDGLKIDIKGPEEVYRKYCLPKEPKDKEPPNVNCEMLSSIPWRNAKLAKDLGLHVEIVNLIIPQVNDSPQAIDWVIQNHLQYLGPESPLHFTRYFPACQFFNPPTPISTLEKAYQKAKSKGILYPYLGNVHGHPFENTFCPTCQTLLIHRLGYRIKTYKITKDKKCPACSTPIPIVTDHPHGINF